LIVVSRRRLRAGRWVIDTVSPRRPRVVRIRLRHSPATTTGGLRLRRTGRRADAVGAGYGEHRDDSAWSAGRADPGRGALRRSVGPDPWEQRGRAGVYRAMQKKGVDNRHDLW